MPIGIHDVNVCPGPWKEKANGGQRRTAWCSQCGMKKPKMSKWGAFGRSVCGRNLAPRVECTAEKHIWGGGTMCQACGVGRTKLNKDMDCPVWIFTRESEVHALDWSRWLYYLKDFVDGAPEKQALG